MLVMLVTKKINLINQCLPSLDHHIGIHETNFWTKRHKHLNMEKYRSYQNSKNTKPDKKKIKQEWPKQAKMLPKCSMHSYGKVHNKKKIAYVLSIKQDGMPANCHGFIKQIYLILL